MPPILELITLVVIILFNAQEDYRLTLILMTALSANAGGSVSFTKNNQTEQYSTARLSDSRSQQASLGTNYSLTPNDLLRELPYPIIIKKHVHVITDLLGALSNSLTDVTCRLIRVLV